MTTHLDNTNEDGYGWAGRAVSIAVIIIVAAFALFLLFGCQSVNKPADPNVALGATERAMVRGDEALKIINDMVEGASGVTKAGLGWVSGILVNQHKDLKDDSAAQILADAAWRKTFDAEHEARLKVENNWWVQAAFFVRKWVYIIAGLYVGFGIASIILGAFIPGWGLTLSKSIIKLLPLANWAAWIRDRIITSRSTG